MGGLKDSAIEGVTLAPLKEIADERGAVLHIMRCDSPLFSQFGEAYCSLTLPGAVKAWKRHHHQTQNFAVPIGKLRVVLYDARPESSSNGRLEQHILGRPGHYCLLRIPPGLWYGFQAIDGQAALIVNLTDIPHDPQESERVDISNGPVEFDWNAV